ncbi:MAG TPA: type II toxin-antitoxin system VapC family toxin [Candidatus Binatia bacterium]|jgi:predicted nucleic acid-binding protein|nr:type II toxin-antitoxin system VapC family toxin [Candidatus Binatia bacterium]
MATRILDSWALMALFNDEPAADEVEKLLQKADAGTHKLLMCVVNWGEIYYSVMRGASPEMAEQKAKEIAAMPIELVPVNDDLHLARQAAIFKATHKMSYADCFAAALAKIKNVELLTGDPEFKAVEGDVKVSWLATK